MSENNNIWLKTLFDYMEKNKIMGKERKIIEELVNENIKLHNIIKEAREYIENNSLYEQDYDYDYEENLVEYPPSDEQAKKDILEILDKGSDKE